MADYRDILYPLPGNSQLLSATFFFYVPIIKVMSSVFVPTQLTSPRDREIYSKAIDSAVPIVLFGKYLLACPIHKINSSEVRNLLYSSISSNWHSA